MTCLNCGKVTETRYWYRGIRLHEVYSDGENMWRGTYCCYDCLLEHVRKTRGKSTNLDRIIKDLEDEMATFEEPHFMIHRCKRKLQFFKWLADKADDEPKYIEQHNTRVSHDYWHNSDGSGTETILRANVQLRSPFSYMSKGERVTTPGFEPREDILVLVMKDFEEIQ